MATIAPAQPSRASERRFFSGMAVAMLVTAFIGFAPTYYLFPWLQGVTVRGVAAGAALTPLVHVHAVIFSAWLVLFLAQARFIAMNRFEFHRAFGIAGIVLAPALIVIGLWTAIASGRNGTSPPGWANPEAFLLVPFTAIALFAGFFIAAIANRHRPDYHKRLMLLATIAMLVPALSRIMRMTQLPFLPPGVWGALIVVNLYLGALVVYDLSSRGRLHTATLWGVAVHLASWPVRLTLGYTEAWQGFAGTLLD